MLLVGMLDSPYVRRAAITGTLLGLKFEHRSVSVFRHMPEFRKINPLIKAPTLVTDDGTVITDSLLVIQHFEDVAGRSLRPIDSAARVRDLSLTGIGIVAADKAVSVEYERKRPEDKRYENWQERILAQLHTALDLLDQAAQRGEIGAGPGSSPAISPRRSPGASAVSSFRISPRRGAGRHWRVRLQPARRLTCSRPGRSTRSSGRRTTRSFRGGP